MHTKEQCIEFFKANFSDALELIGHEHLLNCYFATKPSSLVSVKCDPHHGAKCVLLGDAAHAMVPFYGQGKPSTYCTHHFMHFLLRTFLPSRVPCRGWI